MLPANNTVLHSIVTKVVNTEFFKLTLKIRFYYVYTQFHKGENKINLYLNNGVRNVCIRKGKERKAPVIISHPCGASAMAQAVEPVISFLLMM